MPGEVVVSLVWWWVSLFFFIFFPLCGRFLLNVFGVRTYIRTRYVFLVESGLFVCVYALVYGKSRGVSVFYRSIRYGIPPTFRRIYIPQSFFPGVWFLGLLCTWLMLSRDGVSFLV